MRGGHYVFTDATREVQMQTVGGIQHAVQMTEEAQRQMTALQHQMQVLGESQQGGSSDRGRETPNECSSEETARDW